MMPMRMANGVDTRRILLVGCMGVESSAKQRPLVGSCRKEALVLQSLRLFLPYCPWAEPAPTDNDDDDDDSHHVLLIGFFLPGHAPCSSLSATKVGPFTFTTKATSEKFGVHLPAHARHTPLCDPLLSR